MLKKLCKKEYKKKLSLYISIKIYLTIFLTIFTVVYLPVPIAFAIVFCGCMAFGNASFIIFIFKALLDKPYENAMVKYIFLLISFLWIVFLFKSFSSKKKSDKIVTFGIISLEFAEILSLVYIYIYSYISSQTVPFTAWDITAVIVGIAFRLACIALIITAYIKSHRNPPKAVSGQGLAENPAETQLPDTPADKTDS